MDVLLGIKQGNLGLFPVAPITPVVHVLAAVMAEVARLAEGCQVLQAVVFFVVVNVRHSEHYSGGSVFDL